MLKCTLKCQATQTNLFLQLITLVDFKQVNILVVFILPRAAKLCWLYFAVGKHEEPHLLFSRYAMLSSSHQQHSKCSGWDVPIYGCCVTARRFGSHHCCFRFPTEHDIFHGIAFLKTFYDLHIFRLCIMLWSSVCLSKHIILVMWQFLTAK